MLENPATRVLDVISSLPPVCIIVIFPLTKYYLGRAVYFVAKIKKRQFYSSLKQQKQLNDGRTKLCENYNTNFLSAKVTNYEVEYYLR
jgi:hypothetical protein